MAKLCRCDLCGVDIPDDAGVTVHIAPPAGCDCPSRRGTDLCDRCMDRLQAFLGSAELAEGFAECVERDTLGDSPHFKEALDKVAAERRRQIEKWGADSDNHPFEQMSILGEECGELCQAVNETYFKRGTHPELGGQDRIIAEAIQVAAVAVSIAESAIKRRHCDG